MQASPTNLSILVVEDDGLFRAMLEAALKAQGHEPVARASVEEALAAYDAGRFDLLLTDLHLPDGDGIGLMRRIRSTDGHISIILMTAQPSDESLGEAIEAGVDDYLVKPFPMGGEYNPLHFAIRKAQAYRRLAVENRRLVGDLQDLNESMTHEIEIAGRVQRALLSRPFQHPSLRVTTSIEQSSGIGGDLFEATPATDGRVFVSMGDVSGHGPAAALVMSLVYGLMQEMSHRPVGPSEAVDTISEAMCALFGSPEDTVFLTLCLGFVDPRTGEVELASAGHWPPISVLPDGRLKVHDIWNGLPCGISETCGTETYHTTLQPGETLVLYTDGITESYGRYGRQFGLSGVQQALRTAAAAGKDITADVVQQAATRYRKGAEPVDDAAVLTATYLES